jgi:protein phosphatase
MKIAIISDLHANIEALKSFPEEFDELWVLGDLVSYGPNPAEVVDEVRKRAALVVRGNHDHAAGTGEDPRCSQAFRAMAMATLAFTSETLELEQKTYLANLPLTAERTVDGVRFFLCHAAPSDPLFTYCRQDSRRWREEVANLGADIILVGHTHLPFELEVGGRLVVNPGSLGQPKNGLTRACYAVWQNGRIELRSYEYPVEETVRKVLAMPVPDDVRRGLANVLRSGGDPNRKQTDKET